MAHNAAPSAASGITSHYPRWTQAYTGKEPTLKLLQRGHLPKTTRRHGPKKRLK